MILKLKPTRDAGVLREIVAIADGHPFVAGFAINLPAGKPDDLNLTSPRASLERMPGAVGGPPVEAYVNAILATLRSITGDRYDLIAAGGVSTAESAYRKLRAGRHRRPALHRPRLPRPSPRQAHPHRPPRPPRPQTASRLARSSSPLNEPSTGSDPLEP